MAYKIKVSQFDGVIIVGNDKYRSHGHYCNHVSGTVIYRFVKVVTGYHGCIKVMTIVWEFPSDSVDFR